MKRIGVRRAVLVCVAAAAVLCGLAAMAWACGETGPWIDLDITGIDEEYEEDPGKYAYVEDLVPIEPNGCAEDAGAHFTLSATNSDKIAVWEEMSKTNEVTLGATGNVDNLLEETLYVECKEPCETVLSLTMSGESNPPENNPDQVKITTIAVEHIQIYAEESWQNVEGETLVLLLGTQYTFRAIPEPSGVSWPTGQPVWTYGEETKHGGTATVTCLYTGQEDLTATYGPSSKTVTTDKILPELQELHFQEPPPPGHTYDITDGQEKWVQGGVNDPGCFQAGGLTAVCIYLHHDKTLTYETGIHVKGDVASWDEYITGGDYPEGETAVGPDWPFRWTDGIGNWTDGTTSDFVDYDTSTDISWYYKVTWGTNEWISVGDSDELKYRIVWDAFEAGAPCSIAESFAASHYTKAHVYDACRWGFEGDSETAVADEVCGSVHRSTVTTSLVHTVANCWGVHDTSDGECDEMATEMAYVMRCLGIETFVALANLYNVSGDANLNGTAALIHHNGHGHCDDCEVDVVKLGQSPFTSNNFQGCAFLSLGDPLRDTICWDCQHNEKQKKYWQLGNDKSNSDDAPGNPPRYGILYDYTWLTDPGGGGTWQQVLSGTGHGGHSINTTCQDCYEHHGN